MVRCLKNGHKLQEGSGMDVYRLLENIISTIIRYNKSYTKISSRRRSDYRAENLVTKKKKKKKKVWLVHLFEDMILNVQ